MSKWAIPELMQHVWIAFRDGKPQGSNGPVDVAFIDIVRGWYCIINHYCSCCYSIRGLCLPPHAEKKRESITTGLRDENFKYKHVNEKPHLQILGYSNDDFTLIHPLSIIHPDDRKPTAINISKILRKGEGSFQLRIKHKQGFYKWLEMSVKSFVDSRGNKSIVSIGRDITERKRAENTIIEENKKLVELSQIKSELIMQASHELKTPLSSIYAASQFLLLNFKDQFGEKALGFIEMIYTGSQKLRQLIENLLDVSRVESGKLNLNLQEENLVEIINDCYTDLKYWSDKRNINIEMKLPKELIIEIDRIRIEQVIINLLSNAIKFTPPKGNIYIYLNINDQWVDLSIRDTGIGLSKKEITLLFQKFGKFK